MAKIHVLKKLASHSSRARSKPPFGQQRIKEIKHTLHSRHFLDTYRESPKAFIRNRVLTFPVVVLFLANYVKGSLQDEIDQLSLAVLKLDVSRRIVTRSAIYQARKKISHKVFIGHLDIICRCLNRRSELQTYQGFRTFAVDGSTMLVPDTQENRDHFGIAKSKKEHKVRAIAGVSVLHDVLNRVTYGAMIASYKTGEPTLAWDHLETAELPHKSQVLLDGGYVSFHLLRHIQDQGHRFCVRVRPNLKVVKQLERTRLREGSCHFKPSKKSREKLCGKRLAKPLRVRVMKCRFEKETIDLMTNLV